MALMGFRTDPIRRVGSRSLHGLIHDSAFVIFVLSFLAALFFLWQWSRKDARWQCHARYTLAAGILAVLLLLLPGVAYYLFLVVLLAWIEATAMTPVAASLQQLARRFSTSLLSTQHFSGQHFSQARLSTRSLLPP